MSCTHIEGLTWLSQNIVHLAHTQLWYFNGYVLANWMIKYCLMKLFLTAIYLIIEPLIEVSQQHTRQYEQRHDGNHVRETSI